MHRVRRAVRLCLVLLLWALNGAAAAEERTAVLELGGAAEWDGPTSHFGPNIAVEVTPIEEWLELELGLSALRVSQATAWESDLLFKKPFDLAPGTELMIGLGPTWTHANVRGERANAAGVEFAFDLMLWPTRRWGWYLEPSYGVSFDGAHSQSVGLTVGLLISVP